MGTRELRTRHAVVEAARAMVGVRFRAQGRGLNGVDCLGLVLVACRSAGLVIDIPPHAHRGATLCLASAWLAAAGCRRAPADARLAGDVLLGSPGARQVHLALWTGFDLIEAHAGLRRVVERPVWPDETWDSAWRLPVGEV